MSLRSRVHWLSRGLAALVLASFAVFGTAEGAAADTDPSGLWYFNALHIQAAHDAGWTGKGVVIADLESSVNLEIPTLVGADVVVEPTPKCWDKAGKPEAFTGRTTAITSWHATNVLSLIVGSGKGYPGQTGVRGIAPDAKVLLFASFPDDPSATNGGTFLNCRNKAGVPVDSDNYAANVVKAVNAGAQIITSSVGVSPSASLDKALAWAEKKGVVVVGALRDNLFQVIPSTLPGTGNGVVAVQAVDASAKAFNVDPVAKVAAPGVKVLAQGAPYSDSWTTQILATGTSSATPIVAGMLALVKQKYPKATGNQLIQSLITNTGTGSHSAGYDSTSGLGYGIASATSMLAVDPTTYPDVNPLISTDAGAAPTAKQIATATDPSTKSPPTAKPATSGWSAALPGWLVPVIIAVVAGLLVIVGIVVLVVVLRRRSGNH